MKEIVTSEQVVRYVARDNPRCWVQHENTTANRIQLHGACGEIAVFSDSRPNRYWHGHYDGIYVEVVSYRDVSYLVRAALCFPNRSRKTVAFTHIYDSYMEAEIAAKGQIRRMYRLLYKSNMQPADL